MKVNIKKFEIQMEVKTKGIEFQVDDNNGQHLGDCIVTKTGLTWCPGRTTPKNGKKVTWEKFIEWANTQK